MPMYTVFSSCFSISYSWLFPCPNSWIQYSNIEPGNTKEAEIDRQLANARIILLLISPDFLASNDCYALQEKAVEGNAKVIPILLRSCAWKSTPLGNLQVLPRDERPIEKHSLDDVFFEVSEEISDVIKEMM
jgi:hypothetical protein